jgi:hypothetical protein
MTAGDYLWTGNVNSDWETSGNWNIILRGAADWPTALDTAEIPGATYNLNINLAHNMTVASLKTIATNPNMALNLGNNSLTVTNDITANGYLKINSSGAATLGMTNLYIGTSGADDSRVELQNVGTVNISGNVNISNIVASTKEGSLKISGFSTVSIGGDVNAGYNGFGGPALGTITVENFVLVNSSGNTTVNLGFILIQGGSDWSFGKDVSIKGGILGVYDGGNIWLNAGKSVILDGQAHLEGDGTIHGDVLVDTGATGLVEGNRTTFDHLYVTGNFGGTHPFKYTVYSDGSLDPSGAMSSTTLVVGGTLDITGQNFADVFELHLDMPGTWNGGDIPLMVVHNINGTFGDCAWGATPPGTLPTLAVGLHWELQLNNAAIDDADPAGVTYSGSGDYVIELVAVP